MPNPGSIRPRVQDLLRLVDLWMGDSVEPSEIADRLRALLELLGATGAAIMSPPPVGFVAAGDFHETRRPDRIEGAEGVSRKQDGIVIRRTGDSPGANVTCVFRFPAGAADDLVTTADAVAIHVAQKLAARSSPDEERFGEYRLLGKIDEGGMARIHLARRGRDEPVALKRIRPHLAADDSFLALFSREAQAAAQIDHPNVVRILEYGVIASQAYLTMSFLRGASLEKLMQRAVAASSLPTVPIILALARDYCAGLAAAHARGVIHCDISPHNLFVTFEGTGVVIDFGVARGVGTSTDSDGIRGKPGYVALEQLSGEPVDPRADVFGLGVTLYQLLVGLAQTPTRTPRGLVPLCEAKPELPSAIGDAVMRSVLIDPAERTPSAQELWSQLSRAAAEASVTIAPQPAMRVWLRDLLGDQEAALRRLLSDGTAATSGAHTFRFD